MIHFGEEAENHIGLLREFLMLQKTFKALSRYAHRKDHLEERRK